MHSTAQRTATLLALLAPPLVAQDLLYEYGADDIGTFPRSAVLLGDVDGDGRGDFGFAFRESEMPVDDEVWVVSGATGLPLYTVDGNLVASAGDVDGDGLPDVLVRDANWGLLVLAGATGSVIHSLPSTGLEGVLSFTGVGDWNGDGFGDFAVGLATFAGPSHGVVHVRSGADASVLVALQAPGWLFGWNVQSAGDLDGDGRAELVVGAPGQFGGDPTNPGSAFVFAASGAMLHAFTGATPGEGFGYAVGGAGDVDGDGVPDLLVGAPWSDAVATDAGAVHVFSGATGLPIHVIHGQLPFSGHLGIDVAGAGDLDGDGLADFAAGELGASTGAVLLAGRLVAFSGATGGELFEVFGDVPNGRFGFRIDAGADVNGDGVPDLIATTNKGPQVKVVSGAPLALVSDEHVFSLSKGGVASFALQAGAAHAGLPFALAGSASGTEPGIPLGGVVLPLVPDAYLAHTALHPGAAPLSGNGGLLDGAGAASAAFSLPPGALPSAAGLLLHHAYAVFDPATASFVLASGAVPLTLVP